MGYIRDSTKLSFPANLWHFDGVTESCTSGCQEGEGRRTGKGKTAFSLLCGRHLEINVSVPWFVWEVIISASAIQHLVPGMVLLELKIE